MGNKGNLGVASVLLNEQGWTREAIANTIPCTPGQVHKYLTGYRVLSQASRTHLLREYGDDAWRLIDACQAARDVHTSTGSRMVGEANTRLTLATKRAAAAALKREAASDGDEEEEDTTLYTIAAWKAKFGEPGSGADVHGRWGGTYATEPDYLDEPCFADWRRLPPPVMGSS